MKNVFDMTNLGLIHYYLGIEFDKKPQHIFISQEKYVGKLLNTYSMMDCNPIATPMENNLKLTSEEGKSFEHPTKYRKLVGSLIYLSITHPGITFVFRIFSKFMQHPCEGHCVAAKIVLKYLKGTKTYDIKFSKVLDFHLASYLDSDFDGDKENGVSASGYSMNLGSTAISWRSCKKYFLADSTTKAEYVVAAQATKEIIWIQKILKDL